MTHPVTKPADSPIAATAHAQLPHSPAHDALTPSALIDPTPQAVYYPAFNGLRGIAVLMVFLCHYAYLVWPVSASSSGASPASISSSSSRASSSPASSSARATPPRFFRTFYWRRTLRIFPLYYAFWIAIFATAWLTPTPSGSWQTLSFLVYLGNWFPISPANPTLTPSSSAAGHGYTSINIAHFWTLCVEEQFYLTWPLVIWLCRETGP